jgi:cobalt/nickel transport system ATP-binding protein
MSIPVFELRDVVYRYRQIMALNRLNLTIRAGQQIVLLGANGSGKSTLLRVLDGLYFPEEGSVSVGGELMNEDRFQDETFAFAFRQKVGFVFQNPDAQLFNPTVFDEVAFGPLQLKWPKSDVLTRVRMMLETMGIAHLQDRAPHHLSGGEKKRVALASVLVLDPEVLLFDEPTAGLDPKSQGQLIDLIAGFGEQGKTVITATHALDIVEDVARECCVMHEGQVVAQGAPEAVLRDVSLLEKTSLIHAHRHRHASGEVHSHAHLHLHHHGHQR